MLALIFLVSFSVIAIVFECGARGPSDDSRNEFADADRALLDVLNDFHPRPFTNERQ